jgi:metal-responsive CopG/Arc/MetJ family transcriptional regulator
MYTLFMRTTVEIRDDLRARLLEIAARRGEKGFSKIVEEALESYLRRDGNGEASRVKALATRGVLTEDEADELEGRAREIRERWR